MMSRTVIIVILGVVLGALGGFLYYYFIGCNSGTCTITSQPVNSTAYGAVMGGLLFSMIGKDKKARDNKE